MRLNFLSYLWVTLCKHFTGNDAALLLCPGFPVWVCSAWILRTIGIWAAWRHFPAIGKLQHISYHRLTASSEVIISIAIIVSTKSTDMALHQDKQTKWQGSVRYNFLVSVSNRPQDDSYVTILFKIINVHLVAALDTCIKHFSWRDISNLLGGRSRLMDFVLEYWAI